MEQTTSASAFTEIYLPSLSILSVAIMLIVTLPAAVLIGYVFGNARRRRLLAAETAVDAEIGASSGGVILALLGLLLAFAFSHALNLSQERKSMLTEEAAAIGSAFQRADYLAEPGRTDLQAALLDYARTRIAPANTHFTSLAHAQAFLDQSLKAQAALWPITLRATADPVPAATKAFVASSVNEVLDSHLRRMQTLSAPVSDFAQGMILATALTGLFIMGNRAGMIGRRLSWRTFVLGTLMFVVMMTIIDTQRSNAGLIQLDQTPMRATILDMEIALRGRR